jgi:hypothetical protein
MALLATKLYVPSARPTVLSRSQLAEPLSLGLLHPLILVSILASYRKTTLLSPYEHMGYRQQGSFGADGSRVLVAYSEPGSSDRFTEICNSMART